MFLDSNFRALDAAQVMYPTMPVQDAAQEAVNR
jgi:hypothetical protein